MAKYAILPHWCEDGIDVLFACDDTGKATHAICNLTRLDTAEDLHVKITDFDEDGGAWKSTFVRAFPVDDGDPHTRPFQVELAAREAYLRRCIDEKTALWPHPDDSMRLSWQAMALAAYNAAVGDDAAWPDDFTDDDLAGFLRHGVIEWKVIMKNTRPEHVVYQGFDEAEAERVLEEGWSTRYIMKNRIIL